MLRAAPAILLVLVLLGAAVAATADARPPESPLELVAPPGDLLVEPAADAAREVGDEPADTDDGGMP